MASLLFTDIKCPQLLQTSIQSARVQHLQCGPSVSLDIKLVSAEIGLMLLTYFGRFCTFVCRAIGDSQIGCSGGAKILQ